MHIELRPGLAWTLTSHTATPWSRVHLGPWCLPGDRPAARLEISDSSSQAPPAGHHPFAGIGFVKWDEAKSRGSCILTPEIGAPESALRLAYMLGTWKSGGLLLHGGGLARGGDGLVTLAESGGGKSTLCDLATGFESLSDETILLEAADRPLVHGTPFRSNSQRLPCHKSAALRALVFLEKAAAPSFRRLPAGAVGPRLLKQVYHPPHWIISTADVLRRVSFFAERVPAYLFVFPKDPRAESALGRLLDDAIAHSAA